jgi:hypothetical protein
VANRNGGPGFHLFYAITPVCTTEKAREHPQRYMRAIRARMVELLGADPNYHGGGVSKTPGHRGGTPSSCTRMSTAWAS